MSIEEDKIAKENMDKLVQSGWLEKNIDKYVQNETDWKPIIWVVLILILTIGTFFYFIANDKFKTEVECPTFTCPEQKSCPSCPANPSCPSCPINTNTCNFPSKIDVNLYNQTGI